MLTSDEAIVGVFSHELHELKGVRGILDQTDEISGDMLKQLITPNRLDRSVVDYANMHSEAWDVGDLRVLFMRAKGDPAKEAEMLGKILDQKAKHVRDLERRVDYIEGMAGGMRR